MRSDNRDTAQMLQDVLVNQDKLLAGIDRIEQRLLAFESQAGLSVSEFVCREAAAAALGRSPSTIDSYRKKHWTEHLHWIADPSGRILYDIELILDWQRTGGNPSEHLKAIMRAGQRRDQRKRQRRKLKN